MTQLKLARLLGRKRNQQALRHVLTTHYPNVSIWSAEKKRLLGPAESPTHTIELADQLVGYTGGNEAALVAAMLAELARKEQEAHVLSDETLALYREINLLYKLADKLASTLDVDKTAKLVLEESQRLIEASDGIVLLNGMRQSARLGGGLNETLLVALLGVDSAEIINDLHQDARYRALAGEIVSIMVTPLVTQGRQIGVLLLANRDKTFYRAAQLKLLNAVATQAAPAIEIALQHAQSLRDAEEREVRLKNQIAALRIELDESHQSKQVAEITKTTYFQSLQQQANALRSLVQHGGSN